MRHTEDREQQGDAEDPSEIDSLVRAVAQVSDAEPPHPAPNLIGQRLGPFEIVGRLGAGGMGEVYAAEDREIGRRVALKVLPAALVQDTQRNRRFAAEAVALAALDHAAIVRYVAHGHTPAGEPFLAM